jgi:hypothetical protein
MKFYTINDLVREYPFCKTKIIKMVKAGIFEPMNDPLTGNRPSRGQKLIFQPEQCDEAINNLFHKTTTEMQ